MLTPEQKRNIPTALTDKYAELAEFILRDLARRIADGAKLTDTAEYQLYRAKALGLSEKEIAAKVAEINGEAAAVIEELIYSAADTADRNDREHLGLSDAVATESNEPLYKLMKAQVAYTCSECENLTNTLGFADHNSDGTVCYRSLTDMYRRQMDAAQLKVMNGVTDYTTALRQAVNKLAASGVRSIDYESGCSRTVEAATRNALMTSISQVTNKISEQNAEEFGADGWEMSAHSGARPSHAVYQGRQYTQKEYEHKIRDLLNDYGCRHDAYPIILGISKPVYTEEELKNIDPPPFTYEGRRYTAYEAQQQMRKMERAMRKQKNRCIVADSAGDKEAFAAASIKLRRQKDIYEDFCRKADSFTQYERTIVGGYDRHLSGKTGAVTRKARAFDRAQIRLTDLKNDDIIEYEKIIDKVATDSSGKRVLSDDVIKTIENKMSVIPEKHRKVIENTVSSIIASEAKGEGSFNLITKVLKLDPDAAEQMILHECGHILADAYGIYDDPEFISILKKDVDLSSYYQLEPIYYEPRKKYVFIIRSEKFINPYQGRCYVDINKINYNDPIDPKELQEYISVGYEEFFENPDNLKKLDPDLYDYIERKMFK